jgi:hypothetical protein
VSEQPTKTVDLHLAYEWTCDACGRINFVSAVAFDSSEEDHDAALREAWGLEDWQTIPDGLGGGLFTRPDSVTCGCGSEFIVNGTGREQESE